MPGTRGFGAGVRKRFIRSLGKRYAAFHLLGHWWAHYLAMTVSLKVVVVRHAQHRNAHSINQSRVIKHQSVCPWACECRGINALFLSAKLRDADAIDGFSPSLFYVSTFDWICNQIQ